MIYQPRPYQHLITAHELERERGGVWAGMGMGKTAATLESIACLQMADSRPALVLAPLRVAQSTWPDEAKKWANLSHLDVVPIVGSEKERVNALARDSAIKTINYENIPWLCERLADKWPFGTVVADESTRLKSFRLGGKSGRRARSIAKIAHKSIDRWINLTGTPSPNGLADLWGQSWFLDAGQRLGRTFTSFTDRWFRQGFNGFGLEALPFAREQIEDALRDLHVTIDPADWFDLEKPIVNVIRVDLPSKARALYRDMERRMFMDLGSDQVEALNAASRVSKCLQIASGFVWVDRERGVWREIHDVKLQALQSITEETSGAPLLIRYHWVPSKERILKAFPYFREFDDDPQTIHDWNAGKIRGLVTHADSAGHGLSLQDGGHHLVTFDDWWNLENALQIIERIGPVRQKQSGYDRAVWHHRILASGTVDEDVVARHETKRSVQDLLLDAMKVRG